MQPRELSAWKPLRTGFIWFILIFIFQMYLNYFATVHATHQNLPPSAVHYGDAPRSDDGSVPLLYLSDPTFWKQPQSDLSSYKTSAHYIWYQFRIPEVEFRDPVLYLIGVEDSVEVYDNGGRELFHTGVMEGPSNRYLGSANYYVSVPQNALGTTIYIGLYSEHTPSMLYPFFDEHSNLKDFFLRKDIEHTLFSLLLLFFSFASFLLYTRNRNEKTAFYLSLISMGLFANVFAESNLHQELLPYPLIFNILIIISLPLTGWALTEFFYHLLHDFPRKKRYFAIMRFFFLLLSVADITLSIYRQPIAAYFAFAIPFVLVFYLILFGLWIGREYRMSGSSDMRLFATGYVVAFLFSAIEVSKLFIDQNQLTHRFPEYWMFIGRSLKFNYTNWGLLVLVIYMGLGIVLRIQNRLRAYARELELKNAVLEETNLAYSRFVPKQFLSHLGRETIIEVRLGDHALRTMTVLFSDIRSFTSISEKMTPEENFRFINNYLSVMEPIINRHGGFIDKYIGDAIMALFDGDSDDAVAAAINMIQELERFNQRRLLENLDPIDIGIGLNTGLLILGTVGGINRMDGTVISDAVNIASRIESLTKEFGSRLLISGSTFSSLKYPEHYSIRELERVKLKGKSQDALIYEVLTGHR